MVGQIQGRSNRPRVNQEHDLFVCGLDLAHDCPACRAANWPEPRRTPSDVANDAWEVLRLEHLRLLRDTPRDRPEIDVDLLGRLVALALDPDCRSLLWKLFRHTFADRLKAAIVATVRAAMGGRN